MTKLEQGGTPIRKIQDKLLEILLYFDSFCRENGLQYVLCGGTCLGAVRHKGFIPWDDDIDVFMLREDYEKLERLWAEKADTARYACVRSNKEINIHHSATEIKDSNTTFINSHSVELDIHHGLMIDVLPVDGIPAGKFRRLCQMVDSMIFCCFNFQRLPQHKSRGIYYLTKLALGVFRTPGIRYALWKGAEKRMSRYGTCVTGKVASLVEGAGIMRLHFPVEWFEKPEYLEFEGHSLPVPADYHNYLQMNFGDYMQLPPEEDRIPRHTTAFIDLDTPYTEYKGIQYCVR